MSHSVDGELISHFIFINELNMFGYISLCRYYVRSIGCEGFRLSPMFSDNFHAECALLLRQQFHQKSSTQKSIRAAFIKNLSVLVRSIGNTANILSDAITIIQQIISPTLRSVSMQLLSPK